MGIPLISSISSTVSPDDPHGTHQTTQNQTAHGDSSFGDSSNTLFSMYVKMAEKEDNKMAERWREDANGILIFVSASNIFHAAGCVNPNL
jgi:hypothetical protein